MRKIITSLFISLDGVVESPEKWQFEHFDDGMMAEMQAQLSAQDAILLGRVTYQEWEGYWPNSTDEPFASFINNTQKYLVTNTMDKADWHKTSLLKGNLVEEISRLKQQPGKNIGTAGSPGLVHSLLENGLVDELVLMVHPIIAGSGKRLFSDKSSLKRLKLLSNTTTPTGVAILRYGQFKGA